MRIEEIRTLQGPNVYHYKPMMVMRLQLEELSATTTAQRPQFVERLLELLPGLKKHHCSLGREGGFVERMGEGTFFGHVVEHVAIELEAICGGRAFHGKTREAGEVGQYYVAVRFESEAGMRYLLRQAVSLVRKLLAGESFDLAPVVEQYRKLSAEHDLGPSTGAIVEAAVKRGIPWLRLDDGNLVQLGFGRHRRLIDAALTDRTSLIAVETVGDKARTKRILHEAGVPVPQGGEARDLDEARALFEEIGVPVVVKPLDGNKGKGLTVGVTTMEELERAFEVAAARCGAVLVEEELKGADYRLLVVNGKVVAASERRPCSVTGDGVSSIRELVEEINRDPARGDDHELPLTKVKLDEQVDGFLSRQGKSVESVPAAGEVVRLRANANLSAGATALDVTDKVHPPTLRICERAAALLGLDVCGVDLITSDISQPLDGGILELNASPGLRMHVAPSEGKPRDVGGAIVDGLFPGGTTGRIPLCSITGTNGKTTVTRLIGHLVTQLGKRVGMTSTDGIRIGPDLVREGDLTGSSSARSVLADPTVEVAVFETARGGIFRRGLGYDWSDVGVITNVGSDHIGQDGLESVEDLIWIKSLVAERVRDGGTLVLNADDANAMEIARSERVDVGRLKLVLFALRPDSEVMAAHLRGGGVGYFVRDGWLVEARGSRERRITPLAEVPLTLGGRAAFQVENVLAATAAARAMGAPLDTVATGLATFVSAHNPGRVNVFAHGNGYVLVDYGHNEAAFRAVGQLLEQWDGPLVGVVGLPGDRSNELITGAAAAVAKTFHRVILREDDDLRGRERGEIIERMREVITRLSPDVRVDSEPSLLRALEGLMDDVADGALAAVFYEHLAEVAELLRSVGAMPVEELPLNPDASATSGTATGAAAPAWRLPPRLG